MEFYKKNNLKILQKHAILSRKRSIDKNLFMQDNDFKHNAKIFKNIRKH